MMRLHREALSGLALMAATLMALACANSPLNKSYDLFLSMTLGGLSLKHWVSDGLMTVFFFSVSLEIKHEIARGELSSLKKAALPVIAAVGGMIIPAIIYSLVNSGKPSIRGWGIPMATDIAFALGALSLLGKRVPSSLKVFLTAFAIIDDLGAIAVIALFYTERIAWMPLFFGFILLGVLYAISRWNTPSLFTYLIFGVLLWLLLLQSGVQVTITGVLLAIMVPNQLGKRFQAVLQPWISFGIMPLFALTNAGVQLTRLSPLHPISAGIVAGLILGKQIGITFFSWVAVRMKFALLPRAATWRQLHGIACLGGIGFTMSLFIANLAFAEPAELDIAKIGILMASLVSGALGITALISNRSRHESKSL